MSAPQPPAMDPFGPTANPRFYVARDATETALRELRRRLELGARPVALTGPSGIGKTMLLRVLTLQLERRFRMVFVPYATLAPAELAAWTLSLLGLEPDHTPEARLLREAQDAARGGTPLLLVIDDADATPTDTARALGRWVRDSEGALRLLVTAPDGPRVGRLLAALGAGTEEVRLSQPMDAPETAEYVQARLTAARAPASVVERFAAETLERIHRESGGVPRRVHEAASRVLREPGSGHREALARHAAEAAAATLESEAPDLGEPLGAGPGEDDLPAARTGGSRPDRGEEDLPADRGIAAPAEGVGAERAAVAGADVARETGAAGPGLRPDAAPPPARTPAAQAPPPERRVRAAGPASRTARGGRRARPRRRVIRPASPGILAPLGIALLVAIAAVLVPLLTPSRLGRDEAPRGAPPVAAPATQTPLTLPVLTEPAPSPAAAPPMGTGSPGRETPETAAGGPAAPGVSELPGEPTGEVASAGAGAAAAPAEAAGSGGDSGPEAVPEAASAAADLTAAPGSQGGMEAPGAGSPGTSGAAPAAAEAAAPGGAGAADAGSPGPPAEAAAPRPGPAAGARSATGGAPPPGGPAHAAAGAGTPRVPTAQEAGEPEAPAPPPAPDVTAAGGASPPASSAAAVPAAQTPETPTAPSAAASEVAAARSGAAPAPNALPEAGEAEGAAPVAPADAGPAGTGTAAAPVREPSAAAFPAALPPDVAPPPAPVRVHVNATPWAEIEVDGVVVGVTPLAGLPLVPGEHTFRARMPDGRVLERRLEIGPETRHVTFE